MLREATTYRQNSSLRLNQWRLGQPSLGDCKHPVPLKCRLIRKDIVCSFLMPFSDVDERDNRLLARPREKILSVVLVAHKITSRLIELRIRPNNHQHISRTVDGNCRRVAESPSRTLYLAITH